MVHTAYYLSNIAEPVKKEQCIYIYIYTYIYSINIYVYIYIIQIDASIFVHLYPEIFYLLCFNVNNESSAAKVGGGSFKHKTL